MERAGSAKVLESSQTVENRSAYLARCQVDTPERIVKFVWKQINARRKNAGAVVDFGCGDARFSRHGNFDTYSGFEIDPLRGPSEPLPYPHKVTIGCAFDSDRMGNYDVCVGNPPYVRHHDLDGNWLQKVERRLAELTAFQSDRRSNAYVYFLWLAIATTSSEGLVAMVIPFEWVSRPASKKVRAFISSCGWDVDVYQIQNAEFERVLTTACVVIIDKQAKNSGCWNFYTLSDDDVVGPIGYATGTSQPQLTYERATAGARAKRGLSPGGQQAFLLTEAERVQFQLLPERDVVAAVSTFRHLEQSQSTLSASLFQRAFVDAGHRCWLLNVDKKPSKMLQSYLDQIPESIRSNYTCEARAVWWKFAMPEPANILYASGFKGARPKMFRNELGAIHVGGIHGIYCEKNSLCKEIYSALQAIDFSARVVSLSNGFLKVEVKQMNSVLNAIFSKIGNRE